MLVYGKCECFVMQILYACVLCASCVSFQCCVLYDLQFVNAGRGCKMRPYGRGILQSRSYENLVGSHVVVVIDLPLRRVAPTTQLLQSSPARRLFHLISRGTTLSGDIQRSSILFEVYRWVQLDRWSVGVFYIGDREGRCGVFRRLCVGVILGWDFYWFELVRRVSLGRESSEGEILGAC